jgi:hypothetical protein
MDLVRMSAPRTKLDEIVDKVCNEGPAIARFSPMERAIVETVVREAFRHGVEQGRAPGWRPMAEYANPRPAPATLSNDGWAVKQLACSRCRKIEFLPGVLEGSTYTCSTCSGTTSGEIRFVAPALPEPPPGFTIWILRKVEP